jgi:hypothetical protein
MVEKRRLKDPECNNGMKNRCARHQLCLKERTSYRIFRKTVEMEIEKQIAGSSTGLLKVTDWTLWRGQLSPK